MRRPIRGCASKPSRRGPEHDGDAEKDGAAFGELPKDFRRLLGLWPYPWKEPESTYDDNGPDKSTVVTIKGVPFEVSPTEERGVNSGRKRFRVVCLNCEILVHSGSTSPTCQIQSHIAVGCEQALKDRLACLQVGKTKSKEFA